MSKLNKFLIILIVLIIFLVGGLGYYTYFVWDKDKDNSDPVEDVVPKEEIGVLEESIKKTISEFPYSQIAKGSITYDDLNKVYMISNAWNALNIDYTTEDTKYAANLKNTKDSDGVAYSKYKTNSIEYFGKKLGLTVAEINEMDINNWNRMLDGNKSYYIVESKTIKDKITELYTSYGTMFDSTFIVDESVLNENYSNTILYDKNIDKVVYHMNSEITLYNEKYVISDELSNGVYKVKYVEGYYEVGDKAYTLKTTDEKTVSIDISTGDKYTILSNALKDNQDKLDKYEITFTKVNGSYQFKSITKI